MKVEVVMFIESRAVTVASQVPGAVPDVTIHEKLKVPTGDSFMKVGAIPNAPLVKPREGLPPVRPQLSPAEIEKFTVPCSVGFAQAFTSTVPDVG